MSFVYQRWKMRATTVMVDHMRSFCDGCNIAIRALTHPFRRVAARVQAEAPWMVALMASTVVGIIPLAAYPYAKGLIWKDERAVAEAERVRLCLQKGIDPYPYMHHKDHVYGNSAPSLMKEKEVPTRIGWEFKALENYYRRKEELRAEVGADLDATVEKLMRLKNEQRAHYDSLRHHTAQEPADLVFQGRRDVDEMKS